jgi:hypothetical protein
MIIANEALNGNENAGHSTISRQLSRADYPRYRESEDPIVQVDRLQMSVTALRPVSSSKSTGANTPSERAIEAARMLTITRQPQRNPSSLSSKILSAQLYYLDQGKKTWLNTRTHYGGLRPT